LETYKASLTSSGFCGVAAREAGSKNIGGKIKSKIHWYFFIEFNL
jgi:hypothetical protein